MSRSGPPDDGKVVFGVAEVLETFLNYLTIDLP